MSSSPRSLSPLIPETTNESMSTTSDVTSTTPALPETTARASPTHHRSGFFDTFTHRIQLKSRATSPAAIDTTATICVSPRTASPESSPQQTRSTLPSKSRSTSSPSTAKPPMEKRHSSGTYTQCGRHGNEWLFKNFSVTEHVKSLLERKDS